MPSGEALRVMHFQIWLQALPLSPGSLLPAFLGASINFQLDQHFKWPCPAALLCLLLYSNMLSC